MKTQIVLKIAFGLLSIATLTACGFNPNSGSAADDYSSGTSLGSTQATTAVAECNQFQSTTGAALAGKVTDYYYNGQLQSDRIRLRLSNLDAQFTNNTAVTFQVFRWRADSYGNVIVDPAPLQFQFEAGASALSAFTPSMNVMNISILNQYNALGINSATVSGFLSATTMVVTGLDTQWQGLRVELLNGSAPIAQVDMLIPMFAANPNTYASTHPAVLNQLHPFWSMRTQKAADSAWASLAQTYCF